MVLILNGIVALLIRIKGIKLLRGQTWVDDPTRVPAKRKYIFATFAAKPCERFREVPLLSCLRNPAKAAKPCESPGMPRKLTPHSYERFGWPETVSTLLS